MTDEAKRGWDGFVLEYGAGTTTSLAEAMGLYLATIAVDPQRLPAWLKAVIRRSREINAEGKPRPHQPDT